MSVVKYRFIEKLAAGMFNPVYNTALAVGDKITDVFGKLQGLLNNRLNRAILTTPWSGGASTTADQTILTLTIPANQLQVGDLIRYEIRGTWTKPNSAGTYIQCWVKANGTRTGAVQYTPSGAVTSREFSYRGTLIVRSIGAAGVVYAASDGHFMTSATASLFLSASGGAVTVNTTNTVTLTMGIVFSNSNASNNVTAEVAFIAQR